MTSWIWTHLLIQAVFLVLINCDDDVEIRCLPIWLPILLLTQEEVLTGNLPYYCGHRRKLPPPRRRFGTGKRETIPYSWPWHVGVYSTFYGSFPFCGGTLIAPHWVLTAAHCIIAMFNCTPPPLGSLFNFTELTGHLLAVRVGDHDYTATTPYQSGLLVEKVILHPNVTPHDTKLGFDVALLKLKHKAKRRAHIQYICLPESYLHLPAKKFCYFAGWGYIVNLVTNELEMGTGTLMEARVPLVPNEQCKEAHWRVQDLRHICTDASYGAACYGDSGGGLHCVGPRGHWIVYGIISYGTANCTGENTVYEWTGRFTKWIKDIVSKN